MNIIETARKPRHIGAALAMIALGIGCSSTAGSDEQENLGSAQLYIAQVPAETQCIKVAVANATRAEQRLLGVTPGQSSVFNLDQLPTGSVTFKGFAYAASCATVTDATLATWRTPDTLATLPAGVATSVSLTFRPNGTADVTADFVADDGTTCPTGQTMCSGTCVNLASDPQNCGACGNVCGGPSAQCLGGACTSGGTFSATFQQGQISGPPGPQCQAWQQFRNTLGSGPFSRIVIESSLGGIQECNQPSTAQQLCQALATGSAMNLNCDGRQWRVETCNGIPAIAVNQLLPGSACSCNAMTAVRPCINTQDWGGVNNQTCNAPTQTLTVRCQ